jgi:hypothetical protein
VNKLLSSPILSDYLLIFIARELDKTTLSDLSCCKPYAKARSIL